MNMATINPKSVVKTMDGKVLGAVAELREDAFKVDVRWRPDYWISRFDVYAADEQEVRLSFSGDAVKAHKLPRPVVTEADSTYIGGL